LILVLNIFVARNRRTADWTTTTALMLVLNFLVARHRLIEDCATTTDEMLLDGKVPGNLVVKGGFPTRLTFE
jgi:hypothetical protein